MQVFFTAARITSWQGSLPIGFVRIPITGIVPCKGHVTVFTGTTHITAIPPLARMLTGLGLPHDRVLSPHMFCSDPYDRSLLVSLASCSFPCEGHVSVSRTAFKFKFTGSTHIKAVPPLTIKCCPHSCYWWWESIRFTVARIRITSWQGSLSPYVLFGSLSLASGIMSMSLHSALIWVISWLFPLSLLNRDRAD
jgi:hypothetical protein